MIRFLSTVATCAFLVASPLSAPMTFTHLGCSY